MELLIRHQRVAGDFGQYDDSATAIAFVTEVVQNRMIHAIESVES